jgi:HD-GYP domain-containing protein (c-di-GMP phosphodiesterase class II)
MNSGIKSIRRTLTRRIGLAAIVVAALFGGLAYMSERGRVAEVVSDRALVGARRFNVQAQAALDSPDGLQPAEFQRQLDAFLLPGAVAHQTGQYILADVYDESGGKLAGFAVESHPQIAEVRRRMAAADHQFSDDIFGRPLFVTVEGRTHIHIAVPLTDSSGRRVAQLEGVFAVSDAGMAIMRGQIARTVGLALLIVFVTALVIYPIILSLIGRIGHMTLHLLDANLSMLRVLGGAVAKRDSDTDAHNYRVTIYSVRLGEALKLSDQGIRALIKGAFIHDIGKIGIRDDVLLKPGKLDEAEFATMKTHVEHGIDLASSSAWLGDGVDVVRCHHEKFNGSGYPAGLAGEDIPEIARIFAICDVFDAVASRRPYKEPCTFEETMEVLDKGKGTHFDPRMLDAFNLIARNLYDEFAGGEEDHAKVVMQEMIQEYFHDSLDALAPVPQVSASALFSTQAKLAGTARSRKAS